MNEFSHYKGCGLKDPINCSGCALISGGNEGPNYSGWPLVYVKHGKKIPLKWYPALVCDLLSSNKPYALHLASELKKAGYKFDYDEEKAKGV